jgi:hypothetical protein
MSEHRETASADIHQAISGLVGDIASGRVEELRSFSRKFGSPSQIFVKKKKTYHAAAGESDFNLVKCPICMLTA